MALECQNTGIFGTNTSIIFTYIEPVIENVRPEISEELEELIEEVAKNNGFSSHTEFVRHATRKYALELRDKDD